MHYGQSIKIAIIKQVTGWLLMILSIVCTAISLLMFLEHLLKQSGDKYAVAVDFLHFMIGMIHNATPYLNVIWQHVPIPNPGQQSDLLFWIIYFCIFIGYALIGSGQRMWRQARHVKERVNDHLLVEKVISNKTNSSAEILNSIDVANYSIFTQIFRLYLLPLMLAVLLLLIIQLIHQQL